MRLLSTSFSPTTYRSLRSFTSHANHGLIQALQMLDTSSLCDADKTLHGSSTGTLHVMTGLQPIPTKHNRTAVGFARTVQCTQRDDILAVLRGLVDAQAGEILVVNSQNSNKAMSGDLFATEAQRKHLHGIIVDGPMRDTASLLQLDCVRCFARSITPYAGTVQSPGQMQVPIDCGGVTVHPGDIVVADSDGIVVGSNELFRKLLPVAQSVQETESKIRDNLLSDEASLENMTNFQEHLQNRLQGKSSSLDFQVGK